MNTIILSCRKQHLYSLFVIIILIIVFLVCSNTIVFAAQYYVGPTGSDGNSGTKVEPWKTLEKANNTVSPGDTVILFPGEYEGSIRPAKSGTKSAPIIFKAEKRRTAILIGGKNSYYGKAVHLDNVEFVQLEGFCIRPNSVDGRWFFAGNTRSVSIIDCFMEKAFGRTPFKVENSKQFTLRDSVLREYSGNEHNMAVFKQSSHILIEGNAISRAGHSPLQFYPDGSVQNVVIRGNVFHAAWGRNFELFGIPYVLFENNIVTNAYNGGHSADPMAKFLVDYGIFRFNKVFRNWGTPLHSSPYRDTLMFSHTRLYNNVFHDNYGPGFCIAGAKSSTKDVIFINNIFLNNDLYGARNQLRMDNGIGRDVKFIHNIISTTPEENSGTISVDGSNGVYPALSLSQAQSDYSNMFQNNLDFPPLFKNESQYNYISKKESPQRDAGRVLTYTIGKGQGSSIKVEDALFFYDGFDIEDERGDFVAIGQNNNLTRIIDVDRDQNILKLDKTITWKDGDPVSIPWSGNAPDIGVYEYDNATYPFVQVEVNPVLIDSEKSTHMQVKTTGIDVSSVVWRLGDGTIHDGLSLIKVYAEPGDYPIRVCVIDENGYKHYGVGYVVVREQKECVHELIHSTFGDNDNSWWWQWQLYRPTPAAYDRVNNGVVDGYSLHVYAPENGGKLPARIYPAGWFIDVSPYIFLRYRIDRNTPLALFLLSFDMSIPSGNRVCIAKTVSSNPIQAERIEAMSMLVDDGQWHDLDFDSRLVRQRFPNLKVLQGLHFEATDQSLIKSGQGFWIDEFAIRGSMTNLMPPNLEIIGTQL